MRELESLLPELEPPHGGPGRLRQRIAQADARHRATTRTLRWSLAVAVPVLALALLLPAPIHRWRHTRELTQTLRMAMQPAAPIHGLTLHDGTALALPSGQNNVHLYLVQSDTAPPPVQARQTAH